MQKKNKIMASLIAVAMLAMSFAVVWTAADTDASDPSLQQMPTISSTNYGEFNITIAYNNTVAGTFCKEGYNAAIAVNSIGLFGLSLDMNYATWQTNPAGSFWGINPYYGAINFPATINGTVYTGASIWYYDEAAGAWERGPTSALGFYKPFEDYALNTANIYLNFYNGLSKELKPSGLPLNNVVPKSTIVGNPNFEVTFHLSANCDLLDPNLNLNYPGKGTAVDAVIAQLAMSPVIATGYGSDCYLALTNATIYGIVSVNAVGQGNVIDYGQVNNVNTSYGSVQDLYYLEYGTDPPNWNGQQPFPTFFYWSVYLGEWTAQEIDNWFALYSDWLLGFMSPLAEAGALDFDDSVLGSWPVSKDFVQDEFTLYYTYS